MSTNKGPRSNKKSTEKLRSVLKVKAYKNKPVNIKVSIPLSNTEKEGLYTPILKGRRPPQFIKHLTNESKVDLANSVARQQLIKAEPPELLEDDVIVKIPKAKRRKKKVTFCDVLQNGVVSGNDAAEGTSTPEKTLASLASELKTHARLATEEKTLATEKNPASPKKRKFPKKATSSKKPTSPKKHTSPKKTTPPKKLLPRRILTRKRLADSKAKQNVKCLKDEPDPVPLKIEIKVEDAQSNNIEDVPEPQEPTVAQAEPELVTPKPKEIKSIVKQAANAKLLLSAEKKVPPPGKKRGPKPKGKQQNTQVSVETTSIVDPLKNKVTEAQVKTTQNQQDAPGLIESRKSSIGSGSSKSWTRDISSSSNTTCVGSFCSNDFVRINKKLPVLKLTNIDSEVKKRQNMARLYECKSSDSENTSVQLNGSLGAHSLNLSASSSRVSTPLRRTERSSDFTDERNSKCSDECSSHNTKKIRFTNKKATKQLLSMTLEKLDQEIIQWMRSDDEYVNADMVKFKDKIFNIMDREFGVITHTQHIKEILKPAISLDSLCEDCDDVNDTEYASDKENSVDENATFNESTTVKETSVENNATVKESTTMKENTAAKENTKVLDDFVIPKRRPSRHLSRTSEGNVSNASTKLETEDEMAEGTSNNYVYYDRHDDDDTLSLFAESLSGFETSKINTTAASVALCKLRPAEEYIPQHVKEDYVPYTERKTYYPTKIKEDAGTMASNVTVCEKQNADSTSIYKQSISTDDSGSYQDIHENVDLDTKPDPPDVVKKTRLMESYFEGMPKARSIVFGYLCFYNLMNCCRKGRSGQCRFVHLIPTREQIEEKLNHLDDRILVREYLLLRKWTELRRMYGMCYVEQCVKRRLTRILVEMAYDFIVKANSESEEDTRLRVHTIEATLLHLNNVELSICEDLLKLPIHPDQPNRTLLCDVFMATMSITQNFSRFKIVFLTLTYFMVGNDRSFNQDVVEHILERVSILPFDEPIVRALIQMMRLTNSDIFNNRMIGHFEKQISESKEVFEDYMLLKNQCVFSSLMASSAVTNTPPLKVDTSALPDNEPQSPADSPDTTLDNIMNNAAEEPPKPIITRTIGMNPLFIFNRPASSPGASQAHIKPNASQAYVNPGPSQAYDNPGTSQTYVSPGASQPYGNPGTSQPYESPGTSQSYGSPGTSKPYVNNTESETTEDSDKRNIRQWRNRSIFPHILPLPKANLPSMRGTPTRGTPTRGLMRPPMRPQKRPSQRIAFNQRLVTFKSPSTYLNRHPGPQY